MSEIQFFTRTIILAQLSGFDINHAIFKSVSLAAKAKIIKFSQPVLIGLSTSAHPCAQLMAGRVWLSACGVSMFIYGQSID